MTEVLDPVKAPVVIKIEPSPIQKQLLRMIELVRDGRWCRDIEDDGYGHHCTVGLIGRVGACPSRHDPLVKALDRSIPPDEFAALRRRAEVSMRPVTSYRENGGTYRGGESETQRICSYNNTIRSEREIIDWYQRALTLAT